MKKLKTISLRISEEEFEIIKNKAEEKELSLSQYLRELAEQKKETEGNENIQEEKFIQKISKSIDDKIAELQKSRRLTPINIFSFFGLGYIFGVASVLVVILIVNNLMQGMWKWRNWKAEK